ncbi:MAG: L,D-transpeptidase family protein, partial [Planctomycetota bacterium]|nr:L,D-transpeptidase family protein [Planctomycetota bacterium]
MTRMGRIVVTAVVAAVLIGLTMLAAHLLRRPGASGPGDLAPLETVETPGVASTEGGEASDEKAAPPRPVAGGKKPVEPSVAEPSPGPAGEKPAPAPEAGGPSGEPAAAELATTALAMVDDRPIVAQKRLSEAVRAGVRGELAVRVNEAIRNLADRLQLSRTCRPHDPYSKTCTVQAGETLTAIGQRFLIPYPLVMRLNGLETTAIRAGQKLKVVQGPVHLEILKGRFELRAWMDEVCLRVYPVALGTNNSTPEGTFNVKNKILNPPYQPQHKPRSEYRAAGASDNPLGTRWIDLGNHYGIHGTIEPESIGHDVSEGCIRMYNRHVEEVYNLVVVGASKV